MKKIGVDREAFIQAYNDGHSYDKLAEMFDVSDRYARQLRDRLNLPKRCPGDRMRGAPAGFVEFVNQNGMSAARNHFTAGWATLDRWAQETGLERRRKKPERTQPLKVPEVPANWHELAPTMFKYQLVDHYGISWLMLERLLALTGTRTRPTVHELAKAKPKPVKAPKQRGRRHSGIFHLQNLQTGFGANDNTDVYGLAAQYLRRWYSNVYRCDIKLYINKSTTFGDENSLPNKGRDHYFVAGLGIITKSELMSLAVKRGFTLMDHEIPEFEGVA